MDTSIGILRAAVTEHETMEEVLKAELADHQARVGAAEEWEARAVELAVQVEALVAHNQVLAHQTPIGTHAPNPSRNSPIKPQYELTYQTAIGTHQPNPKPQTPQKPSPQPPNLRSPQTTKVKGPKP